MLDNLTEQDLKSFVLSSLSWVNFAQKYFKNPDDTDLPLILEPGQIKAINALQFGYDIESVPADYVYRTPPRIAILIWPRQSGKCQTGDTLVQLADGTLKRTDELQPSDIILAYDTEKKEFVKTSQTSFYNGKKECLRIFTRSGRTMDCTCEHPFYAYSSYKVPISYIPAEKLQPGNKIACIRDLTHIETEKNFPEFHTDTSLFWDEVIGIEKIGIRDTYGISVPVYNNHFTNGFLTHNTTSVAAASAAILCLQAGAKIGLMGMSEESSKNLIDRIRGFIENSPFKKEISKNLKMEILMKHGGYVRAHTTSHSIRGQSYHYLLLDEAARIEDEIIEGAAMDTIRKIGTRAVLLSTPAGYRGVLIKYYIQGLRTRKVVCSKCFTEYTQSSFDCFGSWSALTMPPNIPKCECGNADYFYVPGDYTIISIDPFSCSFYNREEIMAELQRRGDTPLARQELLGEIIPEGQSVFRKDWIYGCINDRLQNTMKRDNSIQYIAGIDFGKVHDNSVIAIGHEDRKTQKIILDYIRIIDSKDHGKEYEDIKNQLIEVISFYNPIWIVPDSTGMGEPIVEVMEKDMRMIGWKGRVFSNKNKRLGFIFDIKSKPDLIENLIEYFARGKIEIPPDYEYDVGRFINECLNFSYEMTQTNYIKYGVQVEHDDSVIAVALMVWGHKMKPWTKPVFQFILPRGNL